MSSVIAQGRAFDPAALTTYGADSRVPLTVDLQGRLLISASSSISVAGTQTPGDAVANPTDCLDTRTFLQLWNGATWERARQVAIADGLTGNGQVSNAAVYAFHEDFGQNLQFRMNQAGDAMANPTRLLQTAGYNLGFNGATWDRIRSGAPADSLANPATGNLNTRSFLQLWDGSNWNRAKQSLAGGQLRVGSAPSASDASSFSPSTYTQGGTSATGVIKASAGRLLSLDIWDSDVDGIFMLVNKASAPVNGDTAVLQFVFVADDAQIVGKHKQWGREWFSEMGVYFSTGIAWAWSSTTGTVTLATPGATEVVNATYV